MKATKPYKVGDIFRFELVEGEYGFGRVLLVLDDQCVNPKLIEIESGLNFKIRGVILIEIYKETSSGSFSEGVNNDVLVQSIFTGDSSFSLGQWEVIGNIKVNPEEIEFPEFLLWHGSSHAKFYRGEVITSIEMDGDRVGEIDLYLSRCAPAKIPQITMFELGRIDELDISVENHASRSMAKYDLRFSPYREEIYALLPEEFNQPYYELAKSRGFDLKRFYEL